MRPFGDNVLVREAKPAKRPDLKTKQKEKNDDARVNSSCSALLCSAPVFRLNTEWAHSRFSPSLMCECLIKAGARGQREVPRPLGGAAVPKPERQKLVDVVPPSLVTDFTSFSAGWVENQPAKIKNDSLCLLYSPCPLLPSVSSFLTPLPALSHPPFLSCRTRRRDETFPLFFYSLKKRETKL